LYVIENAEFGGDKHGSLPSPKLTKLMTTEDTEATEERGGSVVSFSSPIFLRDLGVLGD
jgi:hypothetical protein